MKSVIEITDSNFETDIGKAALALVDFWAPWCGPCRQIGPIIEQLADEFQSKAVIGKVNVDENPTLAQRFAIQAIPTIVFFQNGTEKDKIVGLASKANLHDKLTALSKQE